MAVTRRKMFGYAALAPLAAAGLTFAEEKEKKIVTPSTAPAETPALQPELAPGVTLGPLATKGPSLPPREAARRRYFPDVDLLTHEGKKVSFYNDLMRGKIVTINFMFTHCDEICPLVTANLVKVQKQLGDRVGKDVFMYSFSLAGQDSPEALRAYREKYHIKPGWTFLTGTRDTMELLRRKLGFTYPDPVIDGDKTQHIGNVRFGSEPLVIWEVMPGMGSPKYLVQLISYVEKQQQGKPVNGRDLFHSAGSAKG